MSDDPNPQPTDPAPNPAPAPPPGDPKPEPADPTDWKSEARKHEKRSKDNSTRAEKLEAELKAEREQKQAILKAAGLAPDDDPAEAAKRTATERDQAIARAEAAEKALRERDLLDLARDAGHAQNANVPALMNTYSLRRKLAELGDQAGEKEVAALVKAELEANPHLNAAGTSPAASVREPAGGINPRVDPSPGMDRMRAAFAASRK